MKNYTGDALHRLRIVISESFSSFRKNNDLSSASSLAFSATLAMIPALFLLTFVLGALVGSSARALAKTQELLTELIPAYSQDILREVKFITSHMGAIGTLNSVVLLLSITPLAADLRVFLGGIFRRKSGRTFLMEKLFDVSISIIFLLGLTAIAIGGFVITLIEKGNNLRIPLSVERIAPFLFITAVIFWLYTVFSQRVRVVHLLAGAVTTALLWFAVRPAFHLFLLYNPGYGFAFGSLKSFFVVIIWIYFSFVIFLFGAEVAASLGRDETVFIKKLMEGKKNVPSRIIQKYVTVREEGEIIFQEGDPGNSMFSVLKGRVLIRKGEQELGVIAEGKCFGGMSFLLSSPRVATAIALADVELVAINNENITNLMNEYPEFVVDILKDMAARLRDTNKAID